MTEKIAVIGLGYVGLPLAVGLAKAGHNVTGFDINQTRIADLLQRRDMTNEVTAEELAAVKIDFTHDKEKLKSATCFIVTVPTPVDEHHRPDLGPIESACKTVGPFLKKGDIVVFESTVYPGVTDDFCGPLLEKMSGLSCGTDFTLGYSPERINPGDKVHRLETITKVVGAQDEATLERLKNVYGPVIKAGLHLAPSIKVAEAAKVIENIQRDVNIALMNELAMIFHRMDIRTKDVLEAAGTKWNFLKFTPGLVGGHCIGVDPYYLTARAEQLGTHLQVIMAGRRINDGMGAYIAEQLVKELALAGKPIKGAKIGILGVTFKENVPDLRNSRVPDIMQKLQEFGMESIVHDPLADAGEVQHEYGFALQPLSDFHHMDAIILAVPHDQYKKLPLLLSMMKQDGVLMDIKSLFAPKDVTAPQRYWSL